MPHPAELTTPRLLLRAWRDEDLEPFAALNADPEVMTHFPAPLDREAADALASRIRVALDERGWGLWAVEVRETGRFIGFTGLSVPRIDAPFMPAVEVGWRLSRESWGHGYATEAARASVRHAFEEVGLDGLVSMIVPDNLRSRSVATKLGMTRDPADDFVRSDGPPEGPVVHLFRLARADWAAGAAGDAGTAGDAGGAPSSSS